LILIFIKITKIQKRKKIDNLKEKYDIMKKMIKEEYISNDQISDEEIQFRRGCIKDKIKI